MWEEQTFLSTIKSQLRDNLLIVKEEFGDLTEEQLNWKPKANKWSIGECLSHIIKFDELYIESINEALEAQDKESKGKMFHPSWLGRLFMKLSSPDRKSKLKTVKIFKPPFDHIKPVVFDKFERHQADLMELVIESDGKDLRGIKVRSPASSLLRFRLGEVFSILAMHQRRHINQALRVKEQMDAKS